jgi:hypothetical protein
MALEARVVRAFRSVDSPGLWPQCLFPRWSDDDVWLELLATARSPAASARLVTPRP